MANRPVFTISGKKPFYNERLIDFTYYSGFSETQKKKTIKSLHEAFINKYPDNEILEVSTKSDKELGKQLSAFNLSYKLDDADNYSLENVFQASKVFEQGGPYKDLLNKSPKEAKKDTRLRESGKLIAFSISNMEFPLEPKTFFYDWLYTNAVYTQEELTSEIIKYEAFTDIEFNPQKSINCQARSIAIFVSLHKLNMITEALSSPDNFKRIIYNV